jgi:hypothetical protein
MTAFICGNPTDADLRIVEEYRRFLAGERPSAQPIELDDNGQPSHDARRRQQVERLIDLLGMPAELLDFIDDHNTGDHNGYHNTQHCYTVALNAHQGAVHSGLRPVHHFAVVVAGLFHDLGHTGVGTPDSVNVDRAIAVFDSSLTSVNSYFGDNAAEHIRRLIRATQMPLQPAASLSEGIIQDADALQMTEPDSYRWEDGLRSELNGYPTREQSLAFLRNRHWNTDWGRKRATDYFTTLEENHHA